jgi:hypothetical protein
MQSSSKRGPKVKHITYVSSALIFCFVGFTMYEGFIYLNIFVPWFLPMIGMVMAATAASFIGFMAFSKGRAMWHIDRHGLPTAAKKSAVAKKAAS